MSSRPFLEQQRWFTRKLIEKRWRQQGFHTSINFDPNFITECDTQPFDTTHKTVIDHCSEILTEIRGELVSTGAALPTELSFDAVNNDRIVARGYTTALLKKYLVETLNASGSLFGEGRNERRGSILTYCGQDTDIFIRGNELTVLRCLLGKPGKDISFSEMAEAVRNRRNLVQEQSQIPRRGQGQATEAEKTTIRSAINELKEKLKRTTNYEDSPEIIESVRGTGYKIVI